MEFKVVNQSNVSKNDLKICSQILSEAFENEPGMNWIGSPKKFDSWFSATIQLILSFKQNQMIQIWNGNEVIACALVTTPKFKPSILNQFIWSYKILIECGLKAFRNTLLYLKLTEKEKTKNDICLEFIGVSKKNRGKGLSRKMIDFIQAQLRPQSIFLTTADSKNVELYKHLGFQLIQEKSLSSIQIFSMRIISIKY